MLRKNDYEQWLLDPTTKEVRKLVSEIVQRVQDNWADRGFSGIEENAFQQGFVAGLIEIFNIDIEE